MKAFTVLLLALFASQALLVSAGAATEKEEEAPVAPLVACEEAVADSIEPPKGSLLYQSFRTEGEINYECDAAGKPITDTISGTFESERDGNWTATIKFESGNPTITVVHNLGGGKTASNTVVLDSASKTSKKGNDSDINWARWKVSATEGESLENDGLPPIAYVTLEDVFAKVPKECPEGATTAKGDFAANFNFHTCDDLVPTPVGAPVPQPIPAPAPGPAAKVPGPAPTAPNVAPNAPVVAPVVPGVSPSPSGVTNAPAAGPSSGASSRIGNAASLLLVASATMAMMA